MPTCLELKNCSIAKNNAINKKLTRKLTRRSYHTPDLKAIRTYAYVRPGQACCGESAMTNRERTRTKYAVAVVAAALVASLALVATVGLTRREADRREPAILLRRRRDAAADGARVINGNARRPPRAARGLGDGRADG